MSVQIKICGINDEISLKAASRADFIGFVFYQKSPRFVTAIEAQLLSKRCSNNQSKVGLFVNSDINLIEYISDYVGLDYIQLHGTETPDYIKEIKSRVNKRIIKAHLVKTASDIEKSKDFNKCCDMVLFDTKIEKEDIFGGTGKSFDWKLLSDYKSKKKWILAGGLNIENIDKAIAITRSPIVDISSGVESSLGKKSSEKIMEIINHVKKDKNKK